MQRNQDLLLPGHVEHLRTKGITLSKNSENGLQEILQGHASEVFNILLKELRNNDVESPLMFAHENDSMKEAARETFTNVVRLVDISKRFMKQVLEDSAEKQKLAAYVAKCEDQIPAWQERLNKLS